MASTSQLDRENMNSQGSGLDAGDFEAALALTIEESATELGIELVDVDGDDGNPADRAASSKEPDATYGK